MGYAERVLRDWRSSTCDRRTRRPISCCFSFVAEPSFGKDRSVIEKNEGAFVQLDFSRHARERRAARQRGARYVKTDQTSTGYRRPRGAGADDGRA